MAIKAINQCLAVECGAFLCRIVSSEIRLLSRSAPFGLLTGNTCRLNPALDSFEG